MDSASLPFSVHYKQAAKSRQGVQQKFSVCRSLAASQRVHVTRVHIYIFMYVWVCMYVYIYIYIYILIYVRERKRVRERFWCRKSKGNFTLPK